MLACTAPGTRYFCRLRFSLFSFFSLHRNKKCHGFSVGCTRYVRTWYLRTRVGYVLCTTYVQPGISSYVPGMSRLPRYVYVDTYEPGLHPPPKKKRTPSTRIRAYVPGISRLPRYVYVDTYIPGLHPPPQKEQSRLLMKLLQKNKIKIINRNTELCHHRPRSKAHSNEYENNADKAEQSLPAWRGAGRSSRGTKPLLSSSDGARSCRIRLPRDLWTSW